MRIPHITANNFEILSAGKAFQPAPIIEGIVQGESPHSDSPVKQSLHQMSPYEAIGSRH
jgi:hypothetical protein